MSIKGEFVGYENRVVIRASCSYHHPLRSEAARADADVVRGTMTARLLGLGFDVGLAHALLREGIEIGCSDDLIELHRINLPSICHLVPPPQVLPRSAGLLSFPLFYHNLRNNTNPCS